LGAGVGSFAGGAGSGAELDAGVGDGLGAVGALPHALAAQIAMSTTRTLASRFTGTLLSTPELYRRICAASRGPAGRAYMLLS
jgi:hypothetical protein